MLLPFCCFVFHNNYEALLVQQIIKANLNMVQDSHLMCFGEQGGGAGPLLTCAREPEILSCSFDYRKRPWSIISRQARFCSSHPWRLTPPGKQDVQRKELRLRESLLASLSLLIPRKAPHLQERRSSSEMKTSERGNKSKA